MDKLGSIQKNISMFLNWKVSFECSFFATLYCINILYCNTRKSAIIKMKKFYRREFIISIFIGKIGLVFGRKVMTKGKKTKMPLLFIGHGSPMNAIEENDFTKMLKGLSKWIIINEMF